MPLHANGSNGVGTILIFGAAIFLIFVAHSRIAKWHKSWAKCRHGIAGGEVRNLCKECLRETRETEERLRRAQEAFENEQRIKDAALQLREAERSRLVKLIVPSLQELRNLTSQQFEDEIARMFERFGYSVEQTPYVKDHGRDAILKKNGQKFLLECKKYGEGGLSGRRDLQIFFAAMTIDGAAHGHFVSTGAFTKDAIEFAAANRIELIDGNKLLRYMFDSKPLSSDDDKYKSMCARCGKIVFHRLRAPQPVKCASGHEVLPTLDIGAVLSSSGATPNCPDCGAPMRLVHWKRRRFWGCTRYPECRRTQTWRRAR
jgi:HJR/Mrr/RecB family endonuclease